jgi:peptidoglycan-N-acetylglucosamine deacetylase
MSATIFMTFDLDAESLTMEPDVSESARDLTHLSWGAFGPRRGLSRVLALLERLDICTTFFVPGWTVTAHADHVKEIAARGHEIGHHGFQHATSPVTLSASEQRDDFLRGMEAIVECIGVTPRGYRSPFWQLTPVVFELLLEHEMLYDSSCMGDDRAYMERFEGREILELPVHWTLDDFPHLGWKLQYSGPLRHPKEMLETWRGELDAAIEEERQLVLTCHPEIIGRAGPIAAFAQFLEEARQHPGVQFSNCIEFAESWER